MKCGSFEVTKSDFEVNREGHNIHGKKQPPDPHQNIQDTFYVTCLLHCEECNRNYHVKILG